MSAVPLLPLEQVTVKFTHSKESAIPENQVERICVICQDTLRNPTIGHGDHQFHETCGAGALSQRASCPTCRAHVSNATAFADRGVVAASAEEARSQGAVDSGPVVYIPVEQAPQSRLGAMLDGAFTYQPLPHVTVIAPPLGDDINIFASDRVNLGQEVILRESARDKCAVLCGLCCLISIGMGACTWFLLQR